MLQFAPYIHAQLVPVVPFPLLGPDVLELPRRIQKVVGVGLGGEGAHVGLLHKVLVALLLGEGDGVLLGLEVHVRALHRVARGLPAHQRVLPPVALAQHVPVHAPARADLVAGLGGGFGGFVDAGWGGMGVLVGWLEGGSFH